MGKRNSTPCVMVMSQSTGSKQGEMLQMKVTMDGERRWRKTVLMPLRHEGRTTMFDGRRLMVISPQDRMVISQAMAPEMELDRRMRLIEQNYRLTRTRDRSVAGHKSFVIEARPKARGLEMRRFFLDRETHFMLKSEAQLPGGEVRVLQEVLQVQFMDKMPKEALDLSYPSEYKFREVAPPPRFTSVSSVERRLNFEPILPNKIPFGMELEAIDVVESGRGAIVALRLTDGLNTVTAYQWSAQSSPNFRNMPEEALRTESKGVRMAFIGDLPTTFTARILEAFVKALVLGPAQEPGTLSDLQRVLNDVP